MRLIVLDTNVIVSAGLKPNSPPALILMDWVLEGHVHTAASPTIIREYREVCRRPKFRPYGFPPLWLEFLIEESLILPDPKFEDVSLPDPDDAIFLALAQTAGAWLVTGNLKHFPPRERRGVRVLSPAEYLAHLNAHRK